MKKTKINKKRPGLAHFFLKSCKKLDARERKNESLSSSNEKITYEIGTHSQIVLPLSRGKGFEPTIVQL